MNSAKGRKYLTLRYLKQTTRGPSLEELRTVANTLEAIAMERAVKHEVAVRVAGDAEISYLAVYNPQGHVIRISDGNWGFVNAPPGQARFVTPEGCLPLPTPSEARDCCLEKDYLDLFNLETEEQKVLLVASAVQKLDPIGPFVIDNFTGEQGSAKSTASRIHRCLIDPNSTPLRRKPRDERDLMIAAMNSRIITMENMSEMKPWLSDALCALATGSGFSTRQLYTDSTEFIFRAKRPVIVNGIPAFSDRGDFADRSLLFELPSISDHRRLTEKEFDHRWKRAHPRALRALLDLTARAQRLRLEGAVKISRRPRMADFAEIGVAIEMASQEGAGGLSPWPEGTFMNAYEANRLEMQGMTLESGFGGVLVEILSARLLSAEQVEKAYPPKEAEDWNVELGELKDLCNRRTEGNSHLRKIIPNNERWLRTALKRLAPALRLNGVRMTFFKHPVSRRSAVQFTGRYGGDPLGAEDGEVEFTEGGP